MPGVKVKGGTIKPSGNLSENQRVDEGGRESLPRAHCYDLIKSRSIDILPGTGIVSR